VPLDHDERLALRSGRTLLRTGTRTDAGTPVYLVHAVRVGAIPVVAFFELAPDWLWHGSEPGAAASGVLAVIDHDGTLLSATGALPPDLLALYAREALPVDAHQPEVAPRSWNVRGREWRGAAVAMLPQDAHLEAGRWTVIASRPETPVTVLWWQAAGMLPLPLLCAALVIGLACAWLRRRWEPVLASVRAGLRELAAGRYQRIELGKSGEAPRATAVEFNRAIVALADHMRSLSSLSEIDRMLLESAELEACLEPLLERIGRITVCDCAMLVLLDPDVSDYGRAFVSAAGTHAPVSRISLDAALLAQLGQERTGLTVARYEPGRHSLLEPLHEQGAEFYWLWPVISQDQLAAVLAVGYRGVPQVAPEVAGLGTECAARIGVALSNSARGEQLYRQAHYDVLTGLPNRLLFRDRLSQ
jgi:hypothetical protein